MTADPAILKRIRGCPFARSGRVLVRFRANGYSLFARRSREPLARLRLTGNGDEVVLLYPSHRGGWGRSATSAPAPCRSTKRSSASATIHTSWNCARPTIEPRCRIDATQERHSLETTGSCQSTGITSRRRTMQFGASM
ncbi:MAG TPA: hypothetical protein VGC74_00770, partial [Stenotrophomonas sp.]